jgi:hypothetical protein
MIMIVYEDIGMELSRVNVQGLREDPQKCGAVIISPKDVSSLVSPACHMVNSPGILNA